MSKYKQCVIVGIFVAVLGLIAGVLPPVINWEESIGLNLLYSVRGARKPPPEVVVVSIDEATVEKLKLPNDLKQWSRSVHALVTSVISREGAQVIAFDMLFDEPRSDSGDRQFAEAIRRARNVALCGYMKSVSTSPRDRKRENFNIERVLFPIPALKESAVAMAAFPLPKVPIQVNQLWTFKTDAGDLPTLPVVAYQIYALDYYEEWAGLLRKYGGRQAGELPQKKIDLVKQRNIQNTVQDTREIFENDKSLQHNLRNEIKSIEDGTADGRKAAVLQSLVSMYSGPESRYINFYGPSATINTVSYHEVIKNTADSPRFRGKAVFIGMSAEGIRPGERDELYTVFSEETGFNLSGVEIAATAFANILEDSFIRPLPLAVLLPVIAAWGFALGFLSRLVSFAKACLAILALCALYFAAACFQFRETHAWYPLVAPLLIQAPFAVIIGGVWGYAGVYRERENIRKISRYYLPEEVINESARNMADLKAMSREFYGFLLYADIEQYTRFADGRHSQEVISILNRYCESLFGPVQKNGGLISDFIGDSMVAIWEAGTAERIEARAGYQACLAALEISEKVTRFNSDSQVQLPLRIGLHAGSMTKGNVGAFDHLERRLVGSSVNEASRLDGLNKHMGTRITVSEEVISRVSGFFTRPLGRFFLVGISRPMVVYELIGPDAEVGERQKQACEAFAKGLASFGEGRWEEAESHFAETAELNAADGPAAFYLNLCREYKTAPPGDKWDGSVTLSSK